MISLPTDPSPHYRKTSPSKENSRTRHRRLRENTASVSPMYRIERSNITSSRSIFLPFVIPRFAPENQ